MTSAPLPPRNAERLLESLGARDDLRDAVIGDLAQEFVERAEAHGVREARRWYYGESVRAVPHLLRNWSRAVGLRGVAGALGVSVAAWAALGVVGAAIFAIAAGMARAVNIAASARWALTYPAVYFEAIALAIIVGLIGGYIGAWIHHRAALVGAFSVGVVWSSVNLLASFVVDAPPPLWVRLGGPLLLMIGAILGGAARVATTPATSTTEAI